MAVGLLPLLASAALASQVHHMDLEPVLARTRWAVVARVDTVRREVTPDEQRFTWTVTPERTVLGDPPAAGLPYLYAQPVPVLRNAAGDVVGTVSPLLTGSGLEHDVRSGSRWLFLGCDVPGDGARVAFVCRVEPEGSEAVLQDAAVRSLEAPGVAHAAFRVRYAEALDAATLLNAVSDEHLFNRTWTALRAEWQPRFLQDPTMKGSFLRWRGRGIQLAYLLSALPDLSLGAVIDRLADPALVHADLEAWMDEPAYRPVRADLEEHPQEVRGLLCWLRDQGFPAMRQRRYGLELARTRAEVDALLSSLDQPRFRSLLETLSGYHAPEGVMDVRVLAFSRPLAFQLAGPAVGWARNDAHGPWLLAHELLHKYDPSPATLAALEALAAEDPYYKVAFHRICVEHHEGREEELVEAAALAMMEMLGLWSRPRILRRLKTQYWSDAVGQGGAPVAAIVWDALVRTEVRPGLFRYDTFLQGLFQNGVLRAGEVEERFKEVIRPVGGLLGLQIAADPRGAVILKVWDGYPAAAAGLAVGDLVTRANGTGLAGLDLEGMLDALSGPPGASMRLVLDRGVEATCTLK